MDTITAVVELVRENEDMSRTIETYEDWFEALIGQTVTMKYKYKNKTRWMTCVVEEFEEGQGWLVRDLESDEVFPLTLDNLFDGSAIIDKKPEPVERPKRTVTFDE
jgi:hypothetical protein